MKKMKILLVMASLLCVAALAATLPSTLAFIAGYSNTVRNTFRVEFLPPQDVTVPVNVEKSMLCAKNEKVSPEGFSFQLENMDTGDATLLITSKEGLATANLTYTADDLGKTYTYRLYEVNDGRENVVYDKMVYEISITLQLDHQHEMTAVIVMNDNPVTEITAAFTNVYDAGDHPDIPDIPNTGDTNQPILWLWLSLISGAGLVLFSLKKHANGRQ